MLRVPARRVRCGLLSVFVTVGCASSGTEPSVATTHPSGASVVTLALSGRPHGVAVARNGTFFVSQISASSAARGRVDDNTQSVEAVVPVGAGPAHVAVDSSGSFAYTTDQFAGTVSVVAAASNSVVATVPLPAGGFNLLVSPDGSRVFATSSDGTVTFIDAATRRAVASARVGASANGLAYDAARGLLYVSSRDAATVTALNASTAAVVRTYSVPGSPQRLALMRDGATLYMASEAAGLVALDVTTGTHRANAGVEAGAVGLAMSPDEAQLYVTNPPSGTITVVDRASGAVVRSIRAGTPRNVAFNAKGTTALVADESGAVLFIR